MSAPGSINVDIVQSVKVGIIVPRTGGLASYSTTFEQSIELALRDLNTSQTSFSFVMDVADSQTTVSGAMAAATQLISDGVAVIIGPAASANVEGVMSTARDNQVPLISFSASSPSITSLADNGYVYRTAMSDAYQAKVDAKIADLLGFHHAAILHRDDTIGLGYNSSFYSEFMSINSSNTVFTQAYPSSIISTADVSSYVTSVLSSSPEVILLGSFADDAVALVNELQLQGYTGRLLSGDPLLTPSFTDNVDPSYIADMLFTEPGNYRSDVFSSRYNFSFGSDPLVFAPNAYDAAFTAGLAILAGGSTVGSNIKARLDDTDYTGYTGKISFDVNGDLTSATVLIHRFQSAFSQVGTWSLESGFSFNSTLMPPEVITSTVTTTQVTTATPTATPTATATETETTTVNAGMTSTVTSEVTNEVTNNVTITQTLTEGKTPILPWALIIMSLTVMTTYRRRM